jgi:hypothetical protein
MMKNVAWSFFTNNKIGEVDHPSCVLPLIDQDYTPFKSLVKDIATSRKGCTYLKCPAHTDFLRNTWVFCAPFDLTLEIEVDSDSDMVKVHCENISQEIFESIIDTRFLYKTEQAKNPYPLVGIDWLYVFACEEPLMIQVLPAFMHNNEFTDKTTVIPGEYDIGRWTRPVETVFEIKSNRERIVITKGDAISYVKFSSDDQIKMIKSVIPWDEIAQCNDIRNADLFRPLAERYNKLAEVKSNTCPVR